MNNCSTVKSRDNQIMTNTDIYRFIRSSFIKNLEQQLMIVTNLPIRMEPAIILASKVGS